MAITILEYATAHLAKPDEDGSIYLGRIEELGLPFFAGCEVCHASLTCYDAYPSATGNIRCIDCIGALGFETAESFDEFCRRFESGLESADEEELGRYLASFGWTQEEIAIWNDQLSPTS
jgi:hypothetical protein